MKIKTEYNNWNRTKILQKRTKKPAAIAPLLPLTFVVAYQADLAYGTKLNRIKWVEINMMTNMLSASKLCCWCCQHQNFVVVNIKSLPSSQGRVREHPDVREGLDRHAGWPALPFIDRWDTSAQLWFVDNFNTNFVSYCITLCSSEKSHLHSNLMWPLSSPLLCSMLWAAIRLLKSLDIFTDAGRLKAAEESKYHAKTHH